jgi:glycine dehydrogenase subunit 1
MPYIPHSEEDRKEMLKTIGVDRIEDLFVEIPDDLRLKAPLNVPEGLDEYKLFGHLNELASKNMSASDAVCFLGAGIYDRYIPAVVGALISRGEFLTAYTPYQPEASQGYLQTIYEFQTMVAELYGMDLANASMYCGATAMAEGALMACSIKRRSQVVVSEAVHPHYRQVLETYCSPMDVEVKTIPALASGREESLDLVTEEAACLILQQPNFFGMITDIKAAREVCDRTGSLLLVSADPTAAGLLPTPGELGADIVTGEGQPLGIPMGLGGPLLGLFACRREYARQIPGRIVGRTHDEQGRLGYTMTLRTREQDIRRERATSNICTNEALMALAATVYMSAVGKNGIRSVAESTVQNTQYAISRLTEAGARIKYKGSVFGEFVLSLPIEASQVRDELHKRGILAGLPLGEYFEGEEHSLLVAVTEIRTKDEIDWFASELASVLDNEENDLWLVGASLDQSRVQVRQADGHVDARSVETIEKVTVTKSNWSIKDQFGLEMQFTDGALAEIHEEDTAGFEAVMAALSKQLEGWDEEWYEKVVYPPFEKNAAVVFERV